MITGAASGIGRSLARLLSRTGAPVAIADIDEAGLKDTAQSLPGPALSRVLDVRDADDQRRFAAEVRDWLASRPDRPPLAAVFNNAGVAVASSVLDADPDDDEWLRQINFDGVVNGTRAFLPLLVEQDDGVIVNTSSVFGLCGMPYQSAYCASKFAVRGFTDSLRQELRGTGVRAVTVHPGGIKTNIARGSARTRPAWAAARSRWRPSSSSCCGPPRPRRPGSSAAASTRARPASWSARTPTSSTRWPGSPRPTTTT
jgi:NAD(P)-dependent dehydrogenase (short-subunit alcohol dehydrogenase family)